MRRQTCDVPGVRRARMAARQRELRAWPNQNTQVGNDVRRQRLVLGARRRMRSVSSSQERKRFISSRLSAYLALHGWTRATHAIFNHGRSESRCPRIKLQVLKGKDEQINQPAGLCFRNQALDQQPRQLVREELY